MNNIESRVPSYDENKTLQEIHNTLPKNLPSIDFIIHLFEHPKSPFALKGAIDTFNHDAVHILLGRGLTNQDEAFVLGFTSGTSKTMSAFDIHLYKLVAKYLYPKKGSYNGKEELVYKLGIQAGEEVTCKNIFHTDFRRMLDTSIKEIRELIGIDMSIIQKYYDIERKEIADSFVSQRLPI